MASKIEKEVRQIKERNIRVEADKAWETSYARRIMIAASTYVIVTIFLISINAPNPAVSALVPAIGYVISTLSLPFVKKFWVRNFYKKR